MAEKVPDFQERLVMHLEGRLSWEHPFSGLYRLDNEKGVELVANPEYLYSMMAAQEDDRFRPKTQGSVPEFCRRVLGGPTQLSLLINSEGGDEVVKEGLLAVIKSVRNAGGWTLAYGGRNVSGPAARAFFATTKQRRFFSPHSVVKLGLPEDSANLATEKSRIILVEEVRKLALQAAVSGSYRQVEKRLHDAFGDSLSAKAGDFVEFNAYWMDRYKMATKTTSKRNLLQYFLNKTGFPPNLLFGTGPGRFFEENL